MSATPQSPATLPADYGYLVADLPYGFCPGCSHGQVVDALGAALSLRSPDAHNVALVSDIGCVGLVDKHFNLNTFHGLHGRSVTYGTGLKLARPDLEVFVVIGDGGCGIGGHHLIQAARRDLNMTVVVFNNFNYGMTGGEHSATTPVGATTSTTPGGNAETPLDLCALSMAAGATFVARAAAFDKDLPALVARAAAHPGFAIIDVWELCTAYFMPLNHFKKKQLLQLSAEAEMPFGVLREAPRPRRAAAPSRAAQPQNLDLAFDAALSAPLRILVAGSAGQKIKTAATTLARAAIRSRLFASQKDDYPITVKTGHSVSEITLSPRPIRFTGVDVPDVAVVLTQDGLARTRGKLAAMSAEAHLFIDGALTPPQTAAQITTVDFAAAAKEVGREGVSLWSMGWLTARLGFLPGAALDDTVQRYTPPKYRAAAAAAAESGQRAAQPAI